MGVESTQTQKGLRDEEVVCSCLFFNVFPKLSDSFFANSTIAPMFTVGLPLC